MPDIFLSYNRDDQPVARRFAEAFEREGFSVWWDVALRSGEAYDKITEQALSDAKAVVVLWSTRSVESRWVRAEATQADRDGKLVPATIEACKRPIMFELTHTAELSHWRGSPDDKAWLAFLADVRGFVEKGATGVLPPTPTVPAKRGRPRRALVIGGVALAVVAAVAAGAVMLLIQRGGETASQRIAFFGFTAADSSPLANDIAASATDETFQTLIALRLETGSRSATQGVEAAQQRQRAKELDAAYTLGGEVRQTGDRVSITMRLEDVASLTTLWENTVTGGPSDKVSLPVKAAAQATDRVRCIGGLRAALSRADANLRTLTAAACAGGDGVWNRERADLWRDVAAQAPQSVWIQGQFATGIYGFQNTTVVSAAEWPGLLEEARLAAQRAVEIDPSDANARTALAMNAIGAGRPLAEAGAFLANTTDTPDDWRKGIQSRARSRLMAAVGQNVRALADARTAVEFDPLSVSSRTVLGVTLARVDR